MEKSAICRRRWQLLILLLGSLGTAAASSPLTYLGSVLDSVMLSKPEFRKNTAHHHRALEFGDFGEVPDECPATTTCPVVCVANLTECPTVCDPGLTLCSIGTCAEDCDYYDDLELESPCLCDEQPVACPKVVELFDVCYALFQDFYDADAECIEAQEEAIPLLSFTGPWFLACYFSISGITILVFLWCFFNQKAVPVKDSTMPLSSATNKAINSEVWTQTGYKSDILGSFVYILVMLAFIAIQLLLFTLTIMYYMQQEAILKWDPVFLDEVQVLKAFEIVWMVGFVWCFAFRYPDSVRNLFLRRCVMTAATYVTVVAPTKIVEVNEIPGAGERLAAMIFFPFDFVLRGVFSYPYGRPGEEAVYCPITIDASTGTRSFYHRMRRYVFDDESGVFIPGSMSIGTTLGEFLAQAAGISNDEVVKRTGLVGPNFISMDKPTILGSIGKEFSKPFYLYQNFMVWSWAPYWYYYMAIVNTIVRVTGGVVVAIFQYMSDLNLYGISVVEGEVVVLRDGKEEKINVTNVVPGDVVVLKQGVNYCDMVILSADHIIVDESALTGEATPVVKSQIDPTMKTVAYTPKLHKSFTISAGTDILEVGEGGKDLGLVLTTGSFTTNGELLTEVLSYQRHKFRFDDDVKVVLFMLIVEAIFLICLVFYFLSDQWVYAWFYAVFVLGTVIPPLLPTVFVVSVGISAKRLSSRRISCTYPEGILVAGRVDMAFFDKTGTMTKQGMDFISAESSAPDDMEVAAQISLGMAVCHTLTTASSGEMLGNHVDQVSFESTGAKLENKKGDEAARVIYNGGTYTILKKNEFDNHRVTQSVVIEDEKAVKQIFVKGSPEAIKAISIGSTVPANFEKTVLEAAKSGVYQIAIAFKTFDSDGNLADADRDDIEKSLTFGGFINFRNILREETAAVLCELEGGDVATAMITGDNALTGISIARESGMIKGNKKVILGRRADDNEVEWVDVDTQDVLDAPSPNSTSESYLAITGDAWNMLCNNDPKYVSSIAKQIRVFGRCNPSDKASVVTNFAENGYTTLMCGDGQNDCGSLKSAHVGIALSSAEASIVAPFTSLDKTITSVTDVLREGRCALASAFSAYGYYIIYGQVESYLQTIGAYLAITFTEWCWVFLDGIWSITMAFSLPLAKAADKLSPIRPTASLLGYTTVSSLFGMLVWNLFYLVIGLVALYKQDWFTCREWNSDDVSNILTIGDNYETTVLFLIGGYQYIASAIALNFGYTWRENWSKNYVFVFLATLFTVFQFVMTIHPSEFSCIWRVNCDNDHAVRWVTTSYPVAINNPWNTTVMPVSFRWILVAIMAANLITLCAWQYFFVNGILPTMLAKNKAVAIAKSEVKVL